MARKFTESEDGVMRTTLRAGLRSTESELEHLSEIAKNHGKSLTDYLDDVLALAIEEVLETNGGQE